MANVRMVWAMVLGFCLALHGAGKLNGQVFNQPPGPSAKGMEPTAGEIVADEKSGEVKPVSWLSLPMPKITMPKISMPKMPPLWPSGKEGEKPALLSPFVSGVGKITNGTKKAWQGTKEVFSVGAGKDKSQAAPRVASREKPSFMQRLFGRTPEPEGPQTVGEFMRQKRLDP